MTYGRVGKGADVHVTGRGRRGASFGRAAILAATVVAVASCDGESKGTSGPVAASAFAREYADAWCGGLAPCCSSSGYAFDAAQCRQFAATVIDARLKNVPAGSSVVFDETVAGACVDAQRERFSRCDDRDTFQLGNKACEGLYRGTVATGGSCTEDEECAPVAGKAVLCDAGACAISDDVTDYSYPTRVGLGEACNSTCNDDPFLSYCEYLDPASPPLGCFEHEGLVCSWTTHVCVPLPKPGEACSDGGRCPTDTNCYLGKCVTVGPTGPCTAMNECAHTSYCDVDAGMCTPRKPNGQACNDYFECQSATCEDDVCRDWSAATATRCAGGLDG